MKENIQNKITKSDVSSWNTITIKELLTSNDIIPKNFQVK